MKRFEENRKKAEEQRKRDEEAKDKLARILKKDEAEDESKLKLTDDFAREKSNKKAQKK